MVAWSCDDCHRNPEMLRMRGYCGEQGFSEDYRMARRGKDGRMYVDSGDIVSSVRGQGRDDKFYSCPIQESLSAHSFVKGVFDYYRRTNNGENLSVLFSEGATNVLFDSVETARNVVSDIRALENEIASRKRNR